MSPNTFFAVRVIKTHKTALARLVDEALTIRRAGDTALNLKEEYVRNPLPTISVRDPRISPEGVVIKPPVEPPRQDLLEASQGVNPWKRMSGRGEEPRGGEEGTAPKKRRRLNMNSVTKTKKDLDVYVREEEKGISSRRGPQGTPSRLSFKEKLERFRRTEPQPIQNPQTYHLKQTKIQFGSSDIRENFKVKHRKDQEQNIQLKRVAKEELEEVVEKKGEAREDYKIKLDRFRRVEEGKELKEVERREENKGELQDQAGQVQEAGEGGRGEGVGGEGRRG